MTKRLVAALLAGLALAAPAAATAATCPKTTLPDVEDEVMCLECGVPLDVAEGSRQAQREREFIVRQVAACRTKDQIKSALAAQFGDRVLSTPKAKGFGLTAYLVPLAGLLLAGTLVTLAALRWRRRRPRAAPTSPTDAPDARESARLDADIGRYEL